MNPARTIGRLACLLAAALAAALACAAAPALAATPRPRPPGWTELSPLPAGPRPALGFPPGWIDHPPLPAHVHPLATGAIPGWQLTLMAVTVVMLAATLVAIAYPGPGAPRRVSARIATAMTAYRATPIRRGSLPRWPGRPRTPGTTKPVPGLRKGIIMCGIPRIRHRPGRDGTGRCR